MIIVSWNCLGRCCSKGRTVRYLFSWSCPFTYPQSTVVSTAPTHVLRGMFLHLREKFFLETHQTRILELLEHRKEWNEMGLHPSHASSDAVSFSRLDFRHAVATALFRNNDTRSCRLKLGVAMFCSVRTFPAYRV